MRMKKCRVQVHYIQYICIKLNASNNQLEKITQEMDWMLELLMQLPPCLLPLVYPARTWAGASQSCVFSSDCTDPIMRGGLQPSSQYFLYPFLEVNTVQVEFTMQVNITIRFHEAVVTDLQCRQSLHFSSAFQESSKKNASPYVTAKMILE